MFSMSACRLFYLFILLIVLQPNYSEGSDFDSEFSVAPSSEARRLSAFAGHRNRKQEFDNDRERGLAEYLEEIEKHDLLRERALAEFKREKKLASPAEFGPEYEQDLVTKRRFQAHYEEAEQEDFVRRARESIKKSQARKILSEETELDIYSHRPRYAFNSRALYGAKPKWGDSAKKNGAGFSGGGDSSNNRGSSDNFNSPISNPPPISQPPPMDPTPFDDFPPPPPPPLPMDGGGGFEDFPPPPPPPMEDFGF